MKSKFVFGLLAVMMVLVLAPSSFAQVAITINNPPSVQEVQTNRTAETSDPTSPGAGITVSGSLIAQSNLSRTDLILTFPSTITSDFAIPVGDPIRITSATGVFAGAVLSTRIGNQLFISLIGGGADIVGNTDSGSFRVVGVRINGNGLTAPATATASLSNSANNFFLNTSSFPIINALGPGIASLTNGAVTGQADETSIQIFTNRNVTDETASFIVTEGFAGAWRSEDQNEIDCGGSAANCVGVVASQIRHTVSGIPSGATIDWEVVFPTGSALTPTQSGTLTPNSSGVATFTVAFDTTNMAAVESYQVNFDLNPTPLTTNPTAGAITVTATMAPNPPSTSTNANQLATDGTNSLVPTYTVAEVGPLTVGSIVAANTTLLITYALRQAPFDTGIQVANTTLDPFGPSGGGATPTAGNLVFDFFPRNPAGGAGTPFQLVTSSSTVFGGLSADGTLAPGGSFVALLSEILSRTSFTGDFSGYIFVRANFLNAHGTATISDFRTYSLTSNVLVMRPPASQSRNNPNGGAEELHY